MDKNCSTEFNMGDLTITAPAVSPAISQKGSIPIGYPGKLDFFCVYPGSGYYADVLILEDQRAKETYLVSPKLRAELEGDASPAAITLTANQHGELFLWLVKHPSFDGELFSTNRLEAMARARMEWVRLKRRQEKGYEIITASVNFPEPEWPTETFEEILRQTFAGKFISSLDHPIVRRLRGEIQ